MPRTCFHIFAVELLLHTSIALLKSIVRLICLQKSSLKSWYCLSIHLTCPRSFLIYPTFAHNLCTVHLCSVHIFKAQCPPKIYADANFRKRGLWRCGTPPQPQCRSMFSAKQFARREMRDSTDGRVEKYWRTINHKCFENLLKDFIKPKEISSPPFHKVLTSFLSNFN